MVNELEKLAREATPGPWDAKNDNGLQEWLVYSRIKRLLRWKSSGEIVGPDEPRLYPLETTECNAKYIAAASPETILKLIAVVKAAQGLIPDCQSFHHSKKNQHTYLDRCPLVDEFNKALAALEKPDGKSDLFKASEGIDKQT